MHFSNETSDSIAPGSRATLLATLIKSKIPVESGFIVGATAFESFVEANGISEKLEEMLKSVDTSTLREVQAVSRAIKRIIVHSEFPEEIARQIMNMYLSLGQPRVMLSPSFFVSDDHENPLFTEIENTFYGYSGDANVFEGIKEVWSRFFDAKPLFYRLKHGKNHFSLPFSICVQRQSNYKVSAILFTDDPTSQTKQTTLVKAVFGDGALIGELDGADYYWIKRGNGDLYNSLYDTQRERVTIENGRERTITVPLSQRDKRKLSTLQLEAVAKLSDALQHHFFFPQECRIAFMGNQCVVIDTKQFSPGNVTKAKPILPTHETDLPLRNPKAGLIHQLSSAVHLPQATVVEGHLSIDPHSFLDGYQKELTTQKSKLFTHELLHDLEFIVSHTHAHQGIIYNFHSVVDNPDYTLAQLHALLQLHTTHPALPIGLATTATTFEDYQRIISVWIKNGLPRSSKISHLIRLETPATIYHIADFVQIGVDSICVDVDMLSRAVLGTPDSRAGLQDTEALLDMLRKALTATTDLGIGIIFQSTSVPTHAMLKAIQSSDSVEWLTAGKPYVQLTTK